jgi:mRNA interferase MazF
MKKGDLLLVPFPFTDLTSTKQRPALVLISTDYDVTLSFITTKMYWQEDWDIILEPSKNNGLKKTSLLRLAKITTLEKKLITGKLGSISTQKLDEVNEKLKILFELE